MEQQQSFHFDLGGARDGQMTVTAGQNVAWANSNGDTSQVLFAT
jgi:hypothetical protein